MSRGLNALVLVAGVAMFAGCGGGAGGLAGTWTKPMSGEGDLKMVVQGGKAKFHLPDGRWPADVDFEAKLRMVGDSLEVSGDTGPSACKDAAPKYAVAVSGNTVAISGGSSDPCPARHAVLVGTWTKS